MAAARFPALIAIGALWCVAPMIAAAHPGDRAALARFERRIVLYDALRREVAMRVRPHVCRPTRGKSSRKPMRTQPPFVPHDDMPARATSSISPSRRCSSGGSTPRFAARG